VQRRKRLRPSGPAGRPMGANLRTLEDALLQAPQLTPLPQGRIDDTAAAQRDIHDR